MSETQDLPPSSEHEIPLADLPEETEAASLPPVAYVPGQPLPRLWKTEPDPEDEPDQPPEPAGKKAARKKADAAPEARTPARPRSAERRPDPPGSAERRPDPPKPKKKKEELNEKGEKRVLLEETPALDTIESRERARLVMGGLLAFCVLIFGWIAYSTLFPGSGELGGDAAADMPPEAPVAAPGPKPSPEPYARYMLDRAREYAKRDEGKQAVAMLDKVVKTYKGTRAAAEAQAALDRRGQGFPLFTNSPYVAAVRTEAPPPMARPPAGGSGVPPVEAAMPARGVTSVGPLAAPPVRPPGPAAPGGNANPGTVGPAPMPIPPNQPAIAGTPTAPPGVGAGPSTAMPAGPAPTRPPAGPVAVAPPPAQPQPQPAPPGPGDVALVVPAPPANSPPMPSAPGPNDRRQDTLRAPAMRTLPPGFAPRPEAGYHESGWPRVIVGERDGGIMVLVPGGTFTMGSDRGDPWNGPAHLVRLSTYYIDRYEVTNRQFRTFLEDTHYLGRPPGKWLTDAKLRSMSDDAPAVFVSYHDAEQYTLWALKRLPTEAQWEMAARSADGRRHPWGDQPIHWSRPRKFRQIDPVSAFPEDVSPFGVFDLAGNAVEWVRDWFDPKSFDRMRDTTTEDPVGPPEKRKGIQRVVKGCSKDWLAYDRQGMDSDQRSPYVGFRCSLAVEGGEASAIIAPRPAKSETSHPAATPSGAPSPGGTVPF